MSLIDRMISSHGPLVPWLGKHIHRSESKEYTIPMTILFHSTYASHGPPQKVGSLMDTNTLFSRHPLAILTRVSLFRVLFSYFCLHQNDITQAALSRFLARAAGISWTFKRSNRCQCRNFFRGRRFCQTSLPTCLRSFILFSSNQGRRAGQTMGLSYG